MYPLFVYGTLAPNRPNHHIMTPIKDGSWTPAYIYAQLLPNGWGGALGYPAVIPEPIGEHKVRGLIFQSHELDQHWERLDEFEGHAYERIEVEAYLENGESMKAFVYALASNEIEAFRQSQA